MFYVMQEAWANYKDPFVRSAMFFLLNRCSSSGLISSGDVEFNRYNPICLNRLRNLKDLEHFHLMRTNSANFLADIPKSMMETELDYLLIPVGKFNYNLFDTGKSLGNEETKINHDDVASFFKQCDQKCILVYKKHAELFKIYEKSNIMMIDKYGKNTQNKDLCEEMIIANF